MPCKIPNHAKYLFAKCMSFRLIDNFLSHFTFARKFWNTLIRKVFFFFFGTSNVRRICSFLRDQRCPKLRFYKISVCPCEPFLPSSESFPHRQYFNGILLNVSVNEKLNVEHFILNSEHLTVSNIYQSYSMGRWTDEQTMKPSS